METCPMEITSLVQEICSMPVPQEENLVEEEQTSPLVGLKSKVTSLVQEETKKSKTEDKTFVEDEEILPVVLDQDGNPLFNLKVMKKPQNVAKEPYKEKIPEKTSPPAVSPTQGVLVLTQDGKPVLNLGYVKIGKNLKLESTKVLQKPQTCSVGGAVDTVQKQHSPLPLVKGDYPLCQPKESTKTMAYVTKVASTSKGHSTKTSKAASTLVTTKTQESKDTVKLQSFQKAFGGGTLHSQLGTLSVPDDHGFNLEKDKESLITLKTLMCSHFV